MNIATLARIPSCTVFISKNGNLQPCDQADTSHYTAALDSRAAEPGSFFFALKGEKTDGALFIKDALEKGAAGIVLNADSKHILDTVGAQLLENKYVALVSDSTQALLEAARLWRSNFTIPLLGITGSVGKTTTKEMLRSILQKSHIPFYASYKNQNTNLGLSINILNMPLTTNIGVFELGINDKGEMDELAYILKPTHGAITWIGHSHLQGLTSLDDVAREKFKITSHVPAEGTVVLPGDQPFFENKTYSFKTIRFGYKEHNDAVAQNVTIDSSGTSCELAINDKACTLRLQSQSPAHVLNALVASACALSLGISLEVIKEGLETFAPISGRCSTRRICNGRLTLIDDSYNASLESMKNALEMLDAIKHDGPKYAILGSMLEAGENAQALHSEVGKALAQTKNIKNIILVGDDAQLYKEHATSDMHFITAAHAQEAVDYIQSTIPDNALVLVKSSFGVGLNTALANIK
jgi:UDP-N-acetylmuramoyl-tripeptide--D-alanyl-D-alanine ligase